MAAEARLTSPSELKLLEARFFFAKMEASTNNIIEFPLFVSAFLSALRSCASPSRLYSRDLRFRFWYDKLKTTHLNHPTLHLLGKLRDVEVHQTGNLKFGNITFEMPAGVTVDARNLRFSGSGGEMVAEYVGEDGQRKPLANVEFHWIWKSKGEPAVMPLCREGLDLVRKIVDTWVAMKFQE